MLLIILIGKIKALTRVVKLVTPIRFHNTIQQHNSNNESMSPNILLTPDYSYTRKLHRSFKAKCSKLPTCYGGKKSDAIFMPQKTIDNNTGFQKSTLKNQAWIMCRQRNEDNNDVKVPSWSAFQRQTTSAVATSVNVGSLPATIGSPTDSNVILAVIYTKVLQI